jgi:hypothetical protein
MLISVDIETIQLVLAVVNIIKTKLKTIDFVFQTKIENNYLLYCSKKAKQIENN